jgi:uncharacterized iron-regulated membrane protein
MILQVIRSPTAGMATMVLSVVPRSGLTYASLVADLATSLTSYEFHNGAGVVSLYQPTDAIEPSVVTLASLQVQIDNEELAAALPLSAEDATVLDSQLRAFIDSSTGLGNDDLNAIVSVRV